MLPIIQSAPPAIGPETIAERLSGAALSMTTGTPADITSILLGIGVWDLEGVMATAIAGTTVISLRRIALHTVSATMPAFDSWGLSSFSYGGTAGANDVIPTPTRRFTLGSPTTIYLVGRLDFSVSTASAYGRIRAVFVSP